MFIKDKKDDFLHIRLTKKQKEKIYDLAKKQNMTVSDFILYLLQKYYNDL